MGSTEFLDAQKKTADGGGFEGVVVIFGIGITNHWANFKNADIRWGD